MPKHETVDINGHEYLKAVEHWFDFWPPDQGNHPGFNEFIGITSAPLHKRSDGEFVMQVPPEAARRVRLLNSPHYHAILTAYSITKEILRNKMLYKPETLTEVKTNDLHSASLVWRKYHYYSTMWEAHRTFVEYLGTHLPASLPSSDTFLLTEEQAHRMRLLLGPHAHTVIKAYYAKK